MHVAAELSGSRQDNVLHVPHFTLFYAVCKIKDVVSHFLEKI
jgi:hypothetical protein